MSIVEGGDGGHGRRAFQGGSKKKKSMSEKVVVGGLRFRVNIVGGCDRCASFHWSDVSLVIKESGREGIRVAGGRI